jgi:hypothetical protein
MGGALHSFLEKSSPNLCAFPESASKQGNHPRHPASSVPAPGAYLHIAEQLGFLDFMAVPA